MQFFVILSDPGHSHNLVAPQPETAKCIEAGSARGNLYISVRKMYFIRNNG